MKTKIISLLFYSLFICNLLVAREKEAKIPTHANWVISVDMNAFQNSRMGKFIMEKIKNAPNINQKMDGLKNAFGLDLIQMRDINAYGSGEKDEGTAIIRGGINSKQLEGFASLNDKVEIDEYQNTKTYSFKKGALGILSKDSVVVSSNKELLQNSLKAQKEDNKQKHSLHSFVQSIERDQKPIISFAANVLRVNRLQNKIKANHTTTAKELAENISKSLNSVMAGEIIFKKFKNMAIFLDETDNHIRLQVYFQSANDETADHLENIFRSWPSLLALSNGINTKLDELMKHVRFSVERDKKNVGMTALLTHSFFETKITNELAKKIKQKNASQ